jgi:hypothetical protein
VVDHLPVRPAPTPEPTLPTRATLTLLVGRVTTIKLAYWAALTAFEMLLPLVDQRAFAERFPVSLWTAVLTSVGSIVWSRRAARAPDRVVGVLRRSIPTIATTFAATTVVASPASLPLLIVERERSLEACGFGTCHSEALVLWVAILMIGTIVIPGVFAASLRGHDDARSLGH